MLSLETTGSIIFPLTCILLLDSPSSLVQAQNVFRTQHSGSLPDPIHINPSLLALSLSYPPYNIYPVEVEWCDKRIELGGRILVSSLTPSVTLNESLKRKWRFSSLSGGRTCFNCFTEDSRVAVVFQWYWGVKRVYFVGCYCCVSVARGNRPCLWHRSLLKGTFPFINALLPAGAPPSIPELLNGLQSWSTCSISEVRLKPTPTSQAIWPTWLRRQVTWC